MTAKENRLLRELKWGIVHGATKLELEKEHRLKFRSFDRVFSNLIIKELRDRD